MDATAGTTSLSVKEVITSHRKLELLFGSYYSAVEDREAKGADAITLTLQKCVKQAIPPESILKDAKQKEYVFGYIHVLREFLRSFNDTIANFHKYQDPRTRTALRHISSTLHESNQIVSAALSQIDSLSHAASELSSRSDCSEIILMIYIQRMELCLLVFNLARRFQFSKTEVRALVQQIRLRSNQLYGTTAYETEKTKSQLSGVVGILVFSLVATLRQDQADMAMRFDVSSTSRGEIIKALKAEKLQRWQHHGAKAACLLPAAVYVAQHRKLTREEVRGRSKVVLQDPSHSDSKTAPSASGDTKAFEDLVKEGLHSGLPYFAATLSSVDYPLHLRGELAVLLHQLLGDLAWSDQFIHISNTPTHHGRRRQRFSKETFANEVATLGPLAQLIVTLTLVLRLQPHLSLTYFRYVPGIFGGEPIRLIEGESKHEAHVDQSLQGRSWCGSMTWFLGPVLQRIEEDGRAVGHWKAVLFNFLAALAGGPSSPKEADSIVSYFITYTLNSYLKVEFREGTLSHYGDALNEVFIQNVAESNMDEERQVLSRDCWSGVIKCLESSSMESPLKVLADAVNSCSEEVRRAELDRVKAHIYHLEQRLERIKAEVGGDALGGSGIGHIQSFATMEEQLHEYQRQERALNRGDLPRPQQETVCATLNLLKELISGVRLTTIRLMEEEDQKAHLEHHQPILQGLEELKALAETRWNWLWQCCRGHLLEFLVSLIRAGVLAQVKGAALACIGQLAGHPRLSPHVWASLDNLEPQLIATGAVRRRSTGTSGRSELGFVGSGASGSGTQLSSMRSSSTALVPFSDPMRFPQFALSPVPRAGEASHAMVRSNQVRDVADDALAESAKGGFHISVGALSLLSNLFLHRPSTLSRPLSAMRPYVKFVHRLLPELQQPQSKHIPTDSLPNGYPWPADAIAGKLRVLSGVLLTYQRILAQYSIVYPAPQYSSTSAPNLSEESKGGEQMHQQSTQYACNPMYDFSNHPYERSAGFLVLTELLSSETVLTAVKLALLHGGGALGLRRLLQEQRIAQGSPTVLEPKALQEPLSVRGYPLWAKEESSGELASSVDSHMYDHEASKRTKHFLSHSMQLKSEAQREESFNCSRDGISCEADLRCQATLHALSLLEEALKRDAVYMDAINNNPSILHAPGVDSITIPDRLGIVLRREAILPVIASYAGLTEVPLVAFAATRVLHRIATDNSLPPALASYEVQVCLSSARSSLGEDVRIGMKDLLSFDGEPELPELTTGPQRPSYEDLLSRRVSRADPGVWRSGVLQVDTLGIVFPYRTKEELYSISSARQTLLELLLVDSRSAVADQRRMKGAARHFLARWFLGLEKEYTPKSRQEWAALHPTHTLLELVTSDAFRHSCPRSAATAMELMYNIILHNSTSRSFYVCANDYLSTLDISSLRGSHRDALNRGADFFLFLFLENYPSGPDELREIGNHPADAHTLRVLSVADQNTWLLFCIAFSLHRYAREDPALAGHVIRGLFGAPGDQTLFQAHASSDIEVGMEQRCSIVLELLESVIPVPTALPTLSPASQAVLETCAGLVAKGELRGAGETIQLGETTLQLYSAHVLYQALDMYLESSSTSTAAAGEAKDDMKRRLRSELGHWVSEYNSRVRQAYSIYNLVCAWSQIVSISFTSCQEGSLRGSRGANQFQNLQEALVAALRAARHDRMPAHITVRLINTADILVNTIREYGLYFNVPWRNILRPLATIFRRCRGLHADPSETKDADMEGGSSFSFPVHSPELRRALYSIFSSILNLIRDSVCGGALGDTPHSILEQVDDILLREGGIALDVVLDDALAGTSVSRPMAFVCLSSFLSADIKPEKGPQGLAAVRRGNWLNWLFTSDKLLPLVASLGVSDRKESAALAGRRAAASSSPSASQLQLQLFSKPSTSSSYDPAAVKWHTSIVNHGLAFLCEVAVAPNGLEFLLEADVLTLLCHLSSTQRAAEAAAAHRDSRDTPAVSRDANALLKDAAPRLRPVLRLLAMLTQRGLKKAQPLPRELARALYIAADQWLVRHLPLCQLLLGATAACDAADPWSMQLVQLSIDLLRFLWCYAKTDVHAPVGEAAGVPGKALVAQEDIVRVLERKPRVASEDAAVARFHAQERLLLSYCALYLNALSRDKLAPSIGSRVFNASVQKLIDIGKLYNPAKPDPVLQRSIEGLFSVVVSAPELLKTLPAASFESIKKLSLFNISRFCESLWPRFAVVGGSKR